MAILFLNIGDKIFIISFTFFVKGLPLSPPISFFCENFNPFRSNVVFVAMTPSIFSLIKISAIELNSSTVKSGEIFMTRGT